MSTYVERISVKEKIGYSLGDAAANFIFQSLLALQLSFYTDTFGLTAKQAGTLFLVVGLGAACLNPVMGVIADRTTSRFGKFRPWLLWTAVPFGIISVLTFTTPKMSMGNKLLYAWITYTLLRVIYVVNNVPYASLMGVLSGDPDERNSIASWRQIFANSVGFIVGSLAVPMVGYFGAGDSARGYQWTMGIFSGLCVVMFLIAFATTKERIQPDPGSEELVRPRSGGSDKEPAVDGSVPRHHVLFRGHRDARQRDASLLHLQRAQQAGFSWLNGFGLTSLLIGVTFSTPLARRMGKRNLLILSMVLTGIFTAALLFIPPTATVAIIGVKYCGSSPMDGRVPSCGR